MLAGGGALVRGISDLVSNETGILTHVAEDPLLCVVNGCGRVLEDFKRLGPCWMPPSSAVWLTKPWRWVGCRACWIGLYC